MLNIVVKLARCTLGSIMYVIVFILNLASYTLQRVNYDLPDLQLMVLLQFKRK